MRAVPTQEKPDQHLRIACLRISGRPRNLSSYLDGMPTSETRTAQVDVAEAPGGRVLLVDDDPSLRQSGLRVLSRAGFEVEVAPDGEAALACLDRGSFDTVVTDITMPRMNGVELLRRIRQRDLDLPVVLVTAFPQLDSAIQAVQHGALSYLTKPYDVEVFRATVGKAVRLSRLARLKREAVALLGEDLRHFGDRIGLEEAFERALGTMWMAFQPLVSWSEQRIVAYEGLLRCHEPLLTQPEVFIAAGERLGRLHEIGRRGRALIAQQMQELPADTSLFVNLHAHDLLDQELFSPSAPLSLGAERVVLEITERVSLDGVRNCEARMDALRALGYRIALDDIGAGYAGLSSFAQLEPDVVKFDMSLIRGVDDSPIKRRLLRSMVDLFKEMRIMTVAEGVETPAENDCLVALGCDVMQGFLYARPAAGFPQVTWPPKGTDLAPAVQPAPRLA